MGPDRDDPGRRAIAIAAACLVGAALLVAAVARLPVFVATTRQAGVGSGLQPAFHLADVTATVRWVATPVNGAAAGCLFGLRITWLDAPADDRDRGPLGWQVPKLTYRFVPVGTISRGSYGPRHWLPGTYQLTTEGSCGWQATVEPVGPFDPSPAPDNPRFTGDPR